MSTKIDFSRFAHATLPNPRAASGPSRWTVHVVKTTIDGLPSLGLRILFDDEAQRDRFIREQLALEQHCGDPDCDTIPWEAGTADPSASREEPAPRLSPTEVATCGRDGILRPEDVEWDASIGEFRCRKCGSADAVSITSR